MINSHAMGPISCIEVPQNDTQYDRVVIGKAVVTFSRFFVSQPHWLIMAMLRISVI